MNASVRLTATFGLFLLVLANVAYTALISTFGYDDILREPPGQILSAFRAGGSALILSWLGFALSALGLVVLAPQLDRALGERFGVRAPVAAMAGAFAGLVQGLALLRWVFVVPLIANAHAAGDATTQAGAELLFQAPHAFAGVAIGEHAGQILLLVWTGGTSIVLWRAGGIARWLALPGFISLPVWIAAQSELLATVIPGIAIIEAAPAAFMLWQLWIAALCVTLLLPGKPAYPRPLYGATP